MSSHITRASGYAAHGQQSESGVSNALPPHSEAQEQLDDLRAKDSFFVKPEFQYVWRTTSNPFQQGLNTIYSTFHPNNTSANAVPRIARAENRVLTWHLHARHDQTYAINSSPRYMVMVVIENGADTSENDDRIPHALRLARDAMQGNFHLGEEKVEGEEETASQQHQITDNVTPNLPSAGPASPPDIVDSSTTSSTASPKSIKKESPSKLSTDEKTSPGESKVGLRKRKGEDGDHKHRADEDEEEARLRRSLRRRTLRP